MRLAVIGLGTMGFSTARNLLARGHVVVGCDLRADARMALTELGGTSVAHAADLPADTEAVIVFVVNAAQVEDCLFGSHGCAKILPPGTLLVICTTTHPSASREIAAHCDRAGFLMLEAPVSGGAAGARSGSLIFMASGPQSAFERAQPIFDAVAARVFNLGMAYGAGATMKMINQLLVGIHIATAAEAMALGIRAGLAPEQVFEVISASAGNSWVWQDRVPQILRGDDSPLSTVGIFIKDLGIVMDEGRALSFPTPLAATAHQLFLAAAAAGQKDKGDTFVIRVWQALAGIPLPDPPEITAA